MFQVTEKANEMIKAFLKEFWLGTDPSDTAAPFGLTVRNAWLMCVYGRKSILAGGLVLHVARVIPEHAPPPSARAPAARTSRRGTQKRAGILPTAPAGLPCQFDDARPRPRRTPAELLRQRHEVARGPVGGPQPVQEFVGPLHRRPRRPPAPARTAPAARDRRAAG